jgi:hypothetical protein
MPEVQGMRAGNETVPEACRWFLGVRMRGMHEETGRDTEMKLLQKVDGQVVTLTQQIACVQREIAMRQRCYPRWISGGTMT